MARLLLKALETAGLEPHVASTLRVYLKQGDGNLPKLQIAASAEVDRLLGAYKSGTCETPRAWFTYHPYYKSPDLIGPEVAAELCIPYITAEASWSGRRANGAWAEAHKINARALQAGNLHLCLTGRDRAGLSEFLGSQDRLADFPPFIDVSWIEPCPINKDEKAVPVRLLTVAMMRQDVKLESYRMLAEALAGLQHLEWRLDIVGDGEARGDVEAAFEPVERDRLIWHGELGQAELLERYANADVYVWPGFGEAFGLAYLEAQAAGLPVVAQNTKGVPSVVDNGKTGVLTPEGDVEAFRNAVARFVEQPGQRRAMSRNAETFVRTERSLDEASKRLKAVLEPLL